MGKMDEQILVVSREVLFEKEALVFQGVLDESDKVSRISQNLGDNYEIKRRGNAEDDPSFKQPIPYIVIRRGDDIFTYKRLQAGGESRLFDKLSIGAGGHMNANPSIETFSELVLDNLDRELSEELSITSNTRKLEIVGLINDDLNEVGKVHIGVLGVMDLDANASVEVLETDQLEGVWLKASELLTDDNFQKLEPWSQYAVKALV